MPDTTDANDMDREIRANDFKVEAEGLNSGDGRSPEVGTVRLSDLIDRVPDFVPGRGPGWRGPARAAAGRGGRRRREPAARGPGRRRRGSAQRQHPRLTGLAEALAA